MKQAFRCVLFSSACLLFLSGTSDALAGPVSAAFADSATPAAVNPAARQCTALGGISRSADLNYWGGAQLGLCRLPDDGIISDWTLLRTVQGIESKAVRAFAASRWTVSPGPIETWADQACAEAGGTVRDYAEHLRPSSIVRMCEFEDGSLVEAWTLFGGPSMYPELARALGVAAPAQLAFTPCPWPRTCMAPCIPGVPPQGLCLFPSGKVGATSFACCCCGAGTNLFAPFALP